MGIFKTIGHGIAWCLSKIVKGAATVATDASKVEAAAESPLANALAALDPKLGAQVQADIEAVAGAAVAAAMGAGTATAAGGLNIADDVGAVQALERLMQTVGGLFGKKATATT